MPKRVTVYQKFMREMIDTVRRCMFKLEDTATPSSPTLRFASVLSHSDNRRICVSPSATPKFALTGKLHISPERCAQSGGGSNEQYQNRP